MVVFDSAYAETLVRVEETGLWVVPVGTGVGPGALLLTPSAVLSTRSGVTVFVLLSSPSFVRRKVEAVKAAICVVAYLEDSSVAMNDVGGCVVADIDFEEEFIVSTSFPWLLSLLLRISDVAWLMSSLLFVNSSVAVMKLLVLVGVIVCWSVAVAFLF